jgi:hypothetical protein
MLRIRPLLIAGTLVLVVGIGAGIAVVTRHTPAAPAGGQPAANPVAAAPDAPSTPATATPGGKPLNRSAIPPPRRWPPPARSSPASWA